MTKRISLMAGAVLLAAGCTTTDFQSLDRVAEKLRLVENDPKIQTSEFGSPKKMVAIWTDAVYTQPGYAPIRGFGGRLYFYNEKSEPIPVEGQLAVYGYDDSVKGSPARKPDRKFVFTSDQLTQHFSPSQLGASYSVWVPWDEVGGVRKAITLLPVFTSPDGNVIMGQQTFNVLPGSVPENVEAPPQGHFTPLSPTADSGVRPASFERTEQAAAVPRDRWQQTHTFVPKNDSRKRLRSTTIQVPMTMSRRLIQQPLGIGLPAETQDNALQERMEGARRMPPVTDSNARGSEGSNAWSRRGVARATEPSTPLSHATRFGRPRSPVPRGPHERPGRERPPWQPRPAEPQSGPPLPPSLAPSHATAES